MVQLNILSNSVLASHTWLVSELFLSLMITSQRTNNVCSMECALENTRLEAFPHLELYTKLYN